MASHNRLDIWHFIDRPRSRLMQYPLLLDRLLKLKREEKEEGDDLVYIQRARSYTVRMASELDYRIGMAKCQFLKERILPPREPESQALIKCQQSLLLEGSLNIDLRQVKAFLFTELLVLVTEFSPQLTTLRRCSASSRGECLIPNQKPPKHTRSVHVLGPDRSSTKSTGERLALAVGGQSQSMVSSQLARRQPVLSVPWYLEQYRVFGPVIPLRNATLSLGAGINKPNTVRKTYGLDKAGSNSFLLTWPRSGSGATVCPYHPVTRANTLPVTSRRLGFHRSAISMRNSISGMSRRLARRITSPEAYIKLSDTSITLALKTANADEYRLWVKQLKPLVSSVLTETD